MSQKEKKKKSKARVIFEWVFTGVFACLFLVAAAAQIDGMVHAKDNYGQTIRFGYGSFQVKTGSMEPVYKVNTAIITKKISGAELYAKWQAGETVDVTFQHCYKNNDLGSGIPELYYQIPLTNMPMTHRLRNVLVQEDGSYVFVAAGINPNVETSLKGQYQLFVEQNLFGIVVVNSPVLGGFYSFVASPWGLLVLLLIPAGYLVVTSIIDIFKALKESEASDGQPREGNELSSLSNKDIARLKQEMMEKMLQGEDVFAEQPKKEEPKDPLAKYSPEELEALKQELLNESVKEDKHE